MDAWVKSSGICLADGIIDIIRGFTSEDKYYVAYFSDGFDAGIGNLENIIKRSGHLLELRIFDINSELLFTRSSLGDSFSWRIADDREISDSRFCIESRQTLDIDFARSFNFDENGRHILITTGGGRYVLPIRDEDSVVVVDYVRYDENGMGIVADRRIKGFCKAE